MALPTFAIVAVTLNCNLRCVMCDIWKNDVSSELKPEEYAALPLSLRTINVTGGEPFLRRDLPDIIRVIKHQNPTVKLTINTHGFMTDRIRQSVPDILDVDPSIAIRISIDGIGSTHDRIRGIPGGFERALESLRVLKKSGVRNLGLVFTLMDQNSLELMDVYRLSRRLQVHFTTTAVTESPIYFGMGKNALLKSWRMPAQRLITPDMSQPPSFQGQGSSTPGRASAVRGLFRSLWRQRFWSGHPLNVLKAWHEMKMVEFLSTRRRALPCTAGRDFFYLDSTGHVYGCHILPVQLGNLRRESWSTLWEREERRQFARDASECHQCWMVCTTRTSVRRFFPQVGWDLVKGWME